LASGQYTGNYGDPVWDGNPQTLLSQIPDLILVNSRQQNIAVEKLRGVDLTTNSRIATPLGLADFALNATRTLTHYQQLTRASGAIDTVNAVGYPASLRIRGSAGLTHGAYSGFLFVNYVGSYVNPFTTPYSRISAWTTLDMTLRWEGGGGVSVAVSARNLFDRDPPRFEQNPSGFRYDPANSTPFGRMWYVNLGKRW